jgi:hypothetical protein
VHHFGSHPLKSGLETARTKLGQIFAIEEETWTDNRLQFRIRALGQAAKRHGRCSRRSRAAGSDASVAAGADCRQVQRAIQSQGKAMREKK